LVTQLLAVNDRGAGDGEEQKRWGEHTEGRPAQRRNPKTSAIFLVHHFLFRAPESVERSGFVASLSATSKNMMTMR
jgi:hypothetical protein